MQSDIKRSLKESVWLLKFRLYSVEAPQTGTPADPEWHSEGDPFAEPEPWQEMM